MDFHGMFIGSRIIIGFNGNLIVNGFGFWEELEETPVFHGKNDDLRLRFSLEPIH